MNIHVLSIQDSSCLKVIIPYLVPKASRGPAVTSAWLWATVAQIIFALPLRGSLAYRPLRKHLTGQPKSSIMYASVTESAYETQSIQYTVG